MEVLNNLKDVPVPVGPYSQATISKGLLFCTGQLGIDPATGGLVAGGIEDQITQVMENIKAVLAGAKSNPQKILMTTIFITSMSDWATVNKVYSNFVSREAPPARQTVAVKELPMGALVEISVIAEA